jgi:hypothetical protein
MKITIGMWVTEPKPLRSGLPVAWVSMVRELDDGAITDERTHRVLSHSDDQDWQGNPVTVYRLEDSELPVAVYAAKAPLDLSSGHLKVELTPEERIARTARTLRRLQGNS